MNGVPRGSRGLLSYASIFRGSMSDFVGGFSFFLGVQFSLVTEFMRVIISLEEVQKDGYIQLWLECDSSLVCHVFPSKSYVDWFFRNR